MKKLINIKGALSLNKDEQKKINGAVTLGCSSRCYGVPQGSRCYFGGHCLCPGVCLGGGCLPLQKKQQRIYHKINQVLLVIILSKTDLEN